MRLLASTGPESPLRDAFNKDLQHIVFELLVHCHIKRPGTSPDSPRYIHPMDIPLELSGNFMEPRSDHFHSGLDIRTQGREGIPVRAVADGWVSRIKISPWGYGKAVYIEHGHGAHFRLWPPATAWRARWPKPAWTPSTVSKDFSIDIYPDKGAIPVKQGESDRAERQHRGQRRPAPALRDCAAPPSQRALDPELLGDQGPRQDTTPPEIIGVRLYPLTDSSRTGPPYPPKARGFAAQGAGGRYGLKPGEHPTAYGTVGLALHTYDRYDNSGFRFGVRSIELFVDSVPVFSTRFTEVDFDHNRYCNAHMDFGLFKEAKMDYHRCYKLPNNKLRIYGKESAQGRIALVPGRDHHVRFVVTDGRGNTSQLTFMLRGATAQEAHAWPAPPLEGSLFRYDATNVLAEDGIRLTMPAGALYDDVYLRYARKAATPKALTPLHMVHDPFTPIHSSCELAIDVPNLPERHHTKALVVSMDQAGKPSAVGGTWGDGRVTASIKAFGNYTVMVDTVPPTIANIDLRADMRGRSGFSIKITDDLSGIGTYRGSINGHWILLEYEPKTNTLSHTFDKHTQAAGAKDFALEVTDDRGNKTKWGLAFTR
jgi:hypothetical protein